MNTKLDTRMNRLTEQSGTWYNRTHPQRYSQSVLDRIISISKGTSIHYTPLFPYNSSGVAFANRKTYGLRLRTPFVVEQSVYAT